MSSELLGVWAAVVAFLVSVKLDVILALIFVDVVLGVALSVRTGEFQLRALGQFLLTLVLPYVIVYMGLDVALRLVPALNGVLGQGINLLVFGAIVASLGGSIYENFKELGIQVPPVTQGGNDNPAGPAPSSTGNSGRYA